MIKSIQTIPNFFETKQSDGGLFNLKKSKIANDKHDY